MKTKKTKSLQLIKASIASLETKKSLKVVGGVTRIGDCNSRTSLCITSCHAH
ncbi:hypothetical protein [Kordia sp.]|uniref:hypothetical protein n=1 Tax=Kordia sp. TaxID=1965332 RepID=UPI0025B7BC92|nr:hypothetical protein [Kordia sp.]MCH2193362.1 hypothetical protein [Kordia sp.]